MGEAVANDLAKMGIRTRVRSLERATFMEAWRSKKLGGVIVTVSAAPGSTAVRLESFVISSAPYASGGYADIDDLFQQQARERDRTKREALLHQIQRLCMSASCMARSSNRPHCTASDRALRSLQSA
jgi:ABC-type transport system substrate-binding protein